MSDSKAPEPNDFVDADMFDPAVVEAFEESLKKAEETVTAGAREMLERRRRAYVAVFTPGDRTQADIDIVLCDLMYFCRTWRPTFDLNDGMHADHLMKIKEGRREVFQRVKDFSRLGSDALLLKYTDAITRM